MRTGLIVPLLVLTALVPPPGELASQEPSGISVLPDEIVRLPFPWDDLPVELEDPRIRRAAECFEDAWGSGRLLEGLEKRRPLIALPHAGVLCRLERRIELLVAAAPEPYPGDPELAPDDADGLSGVRERNRRDVAAVMPHHRHLSNLRRQVQRLRDTESARSGLAAKLERLAESPPENLETITLAFNIAQSEVCQGSAAAVEEAVGRYVAAYPDLAYLPELSRLFAAVNLSAGVIVPAGVETCERGPALARCAAEPPIPWDSRCWELPEEIDPSRLACAAEQPSLVSTLHSIGSNCRGDYERQFAPFFAAPTGSRGRLAGPHEPAVGVDLADVLRRWRPAAAAAAELLLAGREEDRQAILQPLAVVRSRFAAERVALDVERQRLDAERDALAVLGEEIASLKTAVDELTALIAATSGDIESLSEELAATRAQGELAANDLEIKRQEMDAVADEIEAITLDCAGATYEDCTDAAAKGRFDRRRYAGFERLAEAQDRWRQVMEELLRSQERQLELDGELEAARAQRSDANLGRTAKTQSLVRKEEEFAEREPRYRADEALYGSLRPGFDADESALALCVEESAWPGEATDEPPPDRR